MVEGKGGVLVSHSDLCNVDEGHNRPGGPCALFVSKDARGALAKMSFEDRDLSGDDSGLGPYVLAALQAWEYKFTSKYTEIGAIKKTEAIAETIYGLHTVRYGSSNV